jgi:hypothetical protein
VDARIAPDNTGAVCGICLVVNSADMGKLRLLLGDSIREIRVDGENAVTQ